MKKEETLLVKQSQIKLKKKKKSSASERGVTCKGERTGWRVGDDRRKEKKLFLFVPIVCLFRKGKKKPKKKNQKKVPTLKIFLSFGGPLRSQTPAVYDRRYSQG